MQGITVELQDNYSYIMLFLMLFLAAALILLVVLWARKGQKIPAKEKAVLPTQPPVNPGNHAMGLKRKYDRKLIQLSDEYEKQKISSREAYQMLSRLVRDFAYEMTGVKVQNYTLQELRTTGMPKLAALIEECYVPEFALGNAQGDATESIKKARKVIGEWI